MMKETKKKLDKAFKQSKSWHECLVCFCLAIFLGYMLYKKEGSCDEARGVLIANRLGGAHC